MPPLADISVNDIVVSFDAEDMTHASKTSIPSNQLS